MQCNCPLNTGSYNTRSALCEAWKQISTPAAYCCQWEGLHSIVGWPLGVCRGQCISLYSQHHYVISQCTLPPGSALKCPLMLLRYMLTCWCYGDMYSAIGRGGSNKCEAVICEGLLRCIQGLLILGSPLIDKAGVSSLSFPSHCFGPRVFEHCVHSRVSLKQLLFITYCE